jgi:hypothetical protein
MYADVQNRVAQNRRPHLRAGSHRIRARVKPDLYEQRAIALLISGNY